MTKKITAFLISLILLISFYTINVFAADGKIRAANVNLPDVTAEISGHYGKDDIETVELDGELLTVNDVYRGSEAQSKLVYLLIDISTSMSQSSLNRLKPSLIDYATSMNADDKLILMTFGTSVKTVLTGGESDKKIKDTINSLKCNSPGTTFYKALNNALEDSIKQGDYKRKYAIVVSDGVDYEKGNSSQQEIIDDFNTHRLPVYGMCLSSASKENADGFGYIARSSGGELVKFSAADAASKFKSVKKIINDVTVLELESKNKKSNGIKSLTIDADGLKVEQDVLVNAKADNDAPKIEDIIFSKDSNSFEIVFSEKVENADKISAYDIKKKGGNLLAIVSVQYKDRSAILHMNKKVYSGTYIFSFHGITDASDNENELDQNETEKKIKANPIIIKILIIVGIALIPIAFLLALYLILLNLKKRKHVEKIKDVFITQVEEKEVEHVHIEQPKGLSLKLYIDAGNGQFHNIDYNLIKSMIVGRDEICDVSIDDVNMSRQHFAIEQVENGLAVIDLQTTNGTFVNGVQIKSRTYIANGSRIHAGNSTITIKY